MRSLLDSWIWFGREVTLCGKAVEFEPAGPAAGRSKSQLCVPGKRRAQFRQRGRDSSHCTKGLSRRLCATSTCAPGVTYLDFADLAGPAALFRLAVPYCPVEDLGRKGDRGRRLMRTRIALLGRRHVGWKEKHKGEEQRSAAGCS